MYVLFNNLFLPECILEEAFIYKHKKNCCICFSFMRSSLVIILLKWVPSSREHGEKSPQIIGQYESGFRSSIVIMKALEMRKREKRRFYSSPRQCAVTSRQMTLQKHKLEISIRDSITSSTFSSIFHPLTTLFFIHLDTIINNKMFKSKIL